MRRPPFPPIPGPLPKPPKNPIGKKLLPKSKKTVAEVAADALEEQKKQMARRPRKSKPKYNKNLY